MLPEKPGQLAKRYCVSFSEDQATLLEELARRHNVSVSWLVRRSVEEFIRRQRDRQLELRFDSGTNE